MGGYVSSLMEYGQKLMNQTKTNITLDHLANEVVQVIFKEIVPVARERELNVVIDASESLALSGRYLYTAKDIYSTKKGLHMSKKDIKEMKWYIKTGAKIGQYKMEIGNFRLSKGEGKDDYDLHGVFVLEEDRCNKNKEIELILYNSKDKLLCVADLENSDEGIKNILNEGINLYEYYRK